LFYSLGAKEFYVSDDARWIRKNTNGQVVDEFSAAEFLLAGYVTGSDTLSPHVKQVQAGEALAAVPMSGQLRVTPVRYYEYTHGNCFPESREKLLARLDNTLIAVFERLIRWADGRTIVIPLSGGVDSRLIALMLKRLGYDNIMAFSYGRIGNKESWISRKVASTLGIRWEFVPYSNEAWHRWYQSEEWEMYSQMADNLSSVPHIQDWPAVWELQKQQLVPQDSVFVPGCFAGHSLEPTSFPIVWSKHRAIDQKDLLISICEAFYTLRDWSRQRTELEPKLNEKIVKLLGTRPTYNTEEATDAYECWWWQGYEAKFIINSVRVYDFWGYEWWLPLWDLEIADFWSRVPLAYRLRKNLSRIYFKKLEKKITNSNIRVHRMNSRLVSFAAKILRNTFLYDPVRRIHGLMQYDRHPYAWYGVIPKKTFTCSFTGNENINSYLALETLRRILKDWRQPQKLSKLRDDSPNPSD